MCFTDFRKNVFIKCDSIDPTAFNLTTYTNGSFGELNQVYLLKATLTFKANLFLVLRRIK